MTPRKRKGLPWWAWAIIAAVVLILLVVLAPFVALAALVVLITSIVALVKNKPTWLRFRSRKVAVVALIGSAMVFFVAGSVSSAMNRNDGTASLSAEKALPVAPSPTATRTTAPVDPVDPVDIISTMPFRGTITTAASSAATSGLSALAVLETLAISEQESIAGFSREAFGQLWLDVDGNGCDTRNDTLARDLDGVKKSGGCKVVAGTLDDPYTGAGIVFERGNGTSARVQIDHVVSLEDAWQKGAKQWSDDQRATFANDPLNVLAVAGASSTDRVGRDASAWMPGRAAFHCEFVSTQVSVKATYALSVTQAERDAMAGVLNSCVGQPAITSAFAPIAVIADAVPEPEAEPVPAPPVPAPPAPAPAPPVAPAPAPAPPPASSVFYANCTDVRARGAAPLYADQPGYSRKLDRDGDGVACE